MTHDSRFSQGGVASARGITPFATLRRLANARTSPEQFERCELCCSPLFPEHRHLLEAATRKIVCACDACALRFQAVVEGRFKLIPRDAHALPGFRLADAEWEGFALPINLAFFFYHSASQKMTALYPSPAGATESLLPLSSWQQLVADNPVLERIEPDVEALLVNRVEPTRDYYIAPIDQCFELVGLIRTSWRGLSGGEDVWRRIDGFFARLKERSLPLETEERHA
ncbi:MAG TPA: DUF5947 family protein [Terrimicrobiaceae bacterium]|jgi:Family of unknown function (DUF5947)|nr:DUF5947 family protein [Terrimicrobiaceae bacterium]